MLLESTMSAVSTMSAWGMSPLGPLGPLGRLGCFRTGTASQAFLQLLLENASNKLQAFGSQRLSRAIGCCCWILMLDDVGK